MESPSELRRVLIVDVETDSLDAKTGHLLEVAFAMYSVHYGLIRAGSWLVTAPGNAAVDVNGIPPELLHVDAECSVSPETNSARCQSAASGCDAIIAHNAVFDSQWLPDLGKPWICTMDDVDFPKPSTSRSLTALALAHGVGVVHAHRALSDVMTIVALFDRVREHNDLEPMLVRGLRPKMRIVHRSPYEPDEEIRNAKNRVLKNHRFQWDGAAREWFRMMPTEDTGALPFETKVTW